MTFMHLTSNLRGIPNAWHFWFASVLVYTAQYYKCSGLRPLNMALAFESNRRM